MSDSSQDEGKVEPATSDGKAGAKSKKAPAKRAKRKTTAQVAQQAKFPRHSVEKALRIPEGDLRPECRQTDPVG